MTTEQNPKKAMWLSLIPGLGQIYNKQKTKKKLKKNMTLTIAQAMNPLEVQEENRKKSRKTITQNNKRKKIPPY